MTPDTIGLHFGALCDPIAKQLEEQGVVISENDGKHFQKIADAITLLKLHRILPDSTVSKSQQKLMKQISECIQAGSTS